METVSRDEFTALNEQLAALVEAGVPLDVALGQPDLPAAKALARINATVVRRVSRGESLEEALQGDEQDVPASYRSLVQLGLRTGNLSAALDGSTRVAESVSDSRYALESALVYPLVVCSLAFAGLIGFCLFLVPTLEGMAESSRLVPGPALRMLQTVRDTLPYWAVIVPLAVLLLAAWWWRSRPRRGLVGAPLSGLLAWLPGARRTVFQQRCANFAAALAALLDGGTPLDAALGIAAQSSGDPNLRRGAEALAVAVKDGRFPSDNDPIALRFPPFLRWAIWHAEASLGRGPALQIAANMYRESADRRSERLQALAPVVTVILVGGTVVLLYGLTLFVPVIEMLRALAA